MIVVLVLTMLVVMMAVIMVVVIVRMILAHMVLARMVLARMIVMRVVMMVIMAVIVMRAVTAGGVGAAFGIERRLDLGHARAEPPDHLLDDVIAPDAKTLGHDLGRQMAVAEMPGDPDQMVRIRAANFNQRLRRRDHLDQPAVVEHQRIAATQRDGVFQIEQELESARAGHGHAPPVPVVEIEHDGIGRGLFPAMLAENARGADHVSPLL
jgi:hypothetical protein